MSAILQLATRSVPFFNYSNVFTAHEAEFVSIFREVGRSGAFIMQRHLAQFEKNLAAFVGARHALGVGNATDGLLYALRAAGIGPGDEVILSSHTMVATAAAVHFAGATPIPVECGSDHLIDPQAAEAAITPATRAILPTQLNGRTCDMDALQSDRNAPRADRSGRCRARAGFEVQGTVRGNFRHCIGDQLLSRQGARVFRRRGRCDHER